MTDDQDPIDDSDLPSELDRGLERAFGNGDADDLAPESPSVIERIGAITGRTPAVSLRELEQGGHTPILKPLTKSDGIARESGKYTVHGMLGQGGVGAVHRGHDTDLGRDVAMKFLHERYKDEPTILHRFVEEAQIGGQLQHPGIVPVYELGMSDGRPFFTMKMIKGQTLAKKLAERASPADDRRTFLSIFESVCQTMAYAHARGVVHRDLKPANVMIGSFGEVQVVDWGMGKVLQSGGLEDEKLAAERQTQLSVIETVRSSGHGTQSVMGSVMGTPAYMPPEQARGDVDAMDARSDVFALGAILCEILTGLPPYVGTSHGILGMAAMAQLDDAHARLAACGAEEDLVELATRCLMPAPDARPQSAESVAKAIHEHLAAAERKLHDATVRTLALKRTQKLGIALTIVITAGLAASVWFWRDADAARKLADRRAEDASAARDLAQANLDNFNRLSHVVRLKSAKAEAAEIHPAWPTNSEALRSWLDDDAKGLVDSLPALRSTLAELETAGSPEAADKPSHTTSRFQEDADRFLLSTLQDLVADIEAFERAELRAVQRRLTWSERVEELTITRYRERWDEARTAILAADGNTASELYREVPIELTPQMGLIPLGMNPRTKLWEFYHLRSAWDGNSDPASLELPMHREDGSIEVTGDTGIVFVLLPGATFWMGAQATDPDGPNYDKQAGPIEKPRKIEVQPFLLARHELTQGQWARLWSGDEALRMPSHYTPGHRIEGMDAAVDASHPVENVDWVMSREAMARHALVLPTESQWEYGCRAGTTTPYSCDFELLKDFANLPDATAERADVGWPCESWSDGYVLHAPVGRLGANPFGLHDVHGNVWEWCEDTWGHPASPNVRSGSYDLPVALARSASRNHSAPSLRDRHLGLRPARVITE